MSGPVQTSEIKVLIFKVKNCKSLQSKFDFEPNKILTFEPKSKGDSGGPLVWRVVFKNQNLMFHFQV